MTTLTIPIVQRSQLNILTWVGSVLFHGTLIISALTFFTHMTPQPKSSSFKWKVSLIQPTLAPDPSEHVQTVSRPSPTRHTTLSRPLQHRQVVTRHPVQREQPSITRTAASPKQKHTVIKHLERIQKNPHPVSSTPKSLTTQLVPAPTKVTTTQESTLRQTITTQPTPVKARQAVHTARIETAKPSFPTGKVGKRSRLVKTATTKSVEALFAKGPAVHTQNILQQQTPVVQATATNIARTFVTSPNVKSRTSTQATPQTVSRSMKRQPLASTQQPAKRMLKQSIIHTGTPDTYMTKKRSTRSTPTSISRKVMKSVPKESSHTQRVSNGLSKEVLTFLKLLREKIEKHRQYPHVAKRLGYQGTTTVAFALSHTGNLTLLKVAEPSGHSVLDAAALKAVQNIAPMKPPSTIGGAPIEIPVAFELSR